MVELLGKSKEELRAFCAALGEPAYRGGQIYHALYAERKFDFARMTNLPAALRERLAKEASITLPEVKRRFASSDGSVRYLLGLSGAEEERFNTPIGSGVAPATEERSTPTGSRHDRDLRPGQAPGTEKNQKGTSVAARTASVEAVFMPSEGRQTVCISTQAGCAVDCHFCLTAQLGLIRNLTAGEIIAQVLVALEESGSYQHVAGEKITSGAKAPRLTTQLTWGLKPRSPKDKINTQPSGLGSAQAADAVPFEAPVEAPFSAQDKRDTQDKQTNVVLMGQGEPLLNFEPVMAALRILLDSEGVGLSPKHMTLSTSGIVPGIERLGQEKVRPKLAISLNASNDEERDALMPINKKYPLSALMEACKNYPLRPWEHLTFEYVMLGGVNDSPDDARRVVRLLAPVKRVKVNLIPWNPGQLPYRESSQERIEEFRRILTDKGVPAFVRYSRGRDVMAACGQLALLDVSAQSGLVSIAP